MSSYPTSPFVARTIALADASRQPVVPVSIIASVDRLSPQRFASSSTLSPCFSRYSVMLMGTRVQRRVAAVKIFLDAGCGACNYAGMAQRLSASQLRRNRLCTRILQYEVVEGRREETQTVELARGSAVHAATAANLEHWIKAGRYMAPKRLAQAAADAFDAEAFAVDSWENPSQRGKVKDHVICMSLVHARQVAQDVQPIAVEQKVRAYVPEVGTVISGRIDVVSAPVFVATSRGPAGEKRAAAAARQIRDTKTRDDAPPASPEENDADQLATYWLIGQANGEPDPDLLVDYLWPADGGKAKSIVVPDVIARIPRLVEDYRDLSRMYQTGLFPRTGRGSWICRPGKCAHYDYCVLGSGRTDL